MSYIHYHFPEGVKAFSTRRDGGVGKGAYATFNCTHYCGDEEAVVQANRAILCADWGIKPDRLIIPHQVHDTRMALIDEAFLASSAQERAARLEGVDAVMTDCPDCCVAVSTADCIPILIYNVRAQVVAAIHAGWRGTVARIVTLTLRQMQASYGIRMEDTFAAIGPGISLQAFEVGDEVYEAFRTAGFPMAQIATRQDKWHIDLWECNRLQLLQAGIPALQIELAGICTYHHSHRLFSARKQGIRSGRILTGIMRVE